MPLAFTVIPNASRGITGILVVNALMPANNSILQLPNQVIPNGFSVLIKALPRNPIASLVFIAFDRNALVAGQGYPLSPNEPILYGIDNLADLYISVSVVGIGIAYTCEVKNA
jgi:hypothetical protein